jgi:DNA polymerase-1
VQQYVKFVQYYQDELKLALDIETWGNTLSCVGFAHSPQYSITIRTDSVDRRDCFLPYIRILCESSCEKILQNGLYDYYWLGAYGIKPVNWLWDTMAMAHAINPIGQFSLEFLCSIHLDHYQYWKDEAKDAEEIRKYARDLQSLWTYNGLDCCNTHDLQAQLLPHLDTNGRLNFYNRHYVELFNPLLSLMRHGVNVDTEAQKAWAKELMLGCQQAREELADMAGEDLFATKDFSKVKLHRFFYEKLGIPKRTKVTKGVEGKKRTVTLDKHALNDFIQKSEMPRHKKKYAAAKEPAMLILNFRRSKKKADLMKGAWDKDGRIRCSYKFTTETGRLASSKNPMRKGYNLQNPSRKVRNTFLPDKGRVFVKIDLSQVEDRVVKMLTGADRMVKLANLRPDEFDAHTYNASKIFSVSESEVSKEQRYLGKKAVHGAQRGMTGDKLSNELLADEDAPLVVSPAECQKMIDAYLEDHHEIRDIYFPSIREEMWNNRCLANSWGRIWNIGPFAQFDDDLYRRGYSFKPQSENADLLNQWGLLEAYTFIKVNRMKTRINLQVHDELIASCPPEEAYDYAMFVVRCLEQPRWYLGNKLVVPAGVTPARSWKDSEFEFKSLPSRKEFTDLCYALYDDIKHGRKYE